ncbi:MAG: helix-turn-helix domain-containing protein [Actinobacteria bacterium]|jgi:transcriptional regulator with XRE-family HTH domain|nr:helix-turn-helix domain-containing protein [Actinomycetota bacterium]
MNKNNPADRLRIIRKSKGWSLQDVERNSNGKWKAVVIGSYERADRAISLKKAISLMEFYQVPVSELFPDIPPQVSTRSIAIDLVKLSAVQSEYSSVIQRFVRGICDRRKDWNGQVLTVRVNDLQFLAMLLQQAEPELLTELENLSLLRA